MPNGQQEMRGRDTLFIPHVIFHQIRTATVCITQCQLVLINGRLISAFANFDGCRKSAQLMMQASSIIIQPVILIKAVQILIYACM